MDPLPTAMEEDQLRAYIPSQPNSESFQNQPFTIEDIGDTSVLGLGISAWQELWCDSSPTFTPSPISQGAQNEGGRDGKGKSPWNLIKVQRPLVLEEGVCSHYVRKT